MNLVKLLINSFSLLFCQLSPTMTEFSLESRGSETFRKRFFPASGTPKQLQVSFLKNRRIGERLQSKSKISPLAERPVGEPVELLPFVPYHLPPVPLNPNEFGYQPPKDREEPQRVESQGKRGDKEGIVLRILAPPDHVAKTLASSPKFWLEIAHKRPLQYNLLELNGQSLWQGELLPKSTLFSLNYPTNLPPLKPGKYILAVAVGCPQNCVGIRIAFEKVEPSQALKQSIKEAKTIEEKVKMLAQAGFWYDAQSLLLNSTKTLEIRD